MVALEDRDLDRATGHIAQEIMVLLRETFDVCILYYYAEVDWQPRTRDLTPKTIPGLKQETEVSKFEMCQKIVHNVSK